MQIDRCVCFDLTFTFVLKDARESGILRLDTPYQAGLPEFHALCDRLTPENLRTELGRVIGASLV